MSENPLKALSEYTHFLSQLQHHPTVERSTVVVWSNSPYTGTAEGEVWFKGNLRLRMREEIDFDAELITSYGYEVYRGDEKLYWYDDFPHPQEPSLATTFPHHKHIPPEMKRNRIPAPNISFTRPNLPVLVQEIEALIAQA
ncbi:MAG: DUF6516 family protein [Xenococcus sp. MO_188.B8]|nr:DUF6516 family protein [Xenococcus sp. MO_188.B8]